MKRRELIKHIRKNGCAFLRKGGNHTVYVNRIKMKVSSVPRHTEVDNKLCKKICKDLEIEMP